MANLSNINNILRTGSLGVGINRDPASPFEVSSATKPGIKMFNTATNGKTYQAYSDENGNYIIYDEDADSNRLTINSAGNATFTGNVGIGTTDIGTQSNLYLGAASSSEGGQITLQKATGGTLAAHIDAYTTSSKDYMRILSGTNTATTAAPFVFDLTNVTLGIGTSSPDSPLEIQNVPAQGSQKMMLHIDANHTGNQGSAFLRISAGSSAGANTKIETVSGGGQGLFGTYLDTNIINSAISTGANGNINFITGSSTSASSIVMTIGGGSQKGNVGIGTTSPEHKLVAIGTIGFGLNYNGGVYANNTATSVDENWGLEVQRTANVDDYNTRLKYYPVSGQSRAAGIYDSRNARFSLYSDTNNNPNIIIPYGNVGIGTTSPGHPLEVIGFISTNNSSNGSGLLIRKNSSTIGFIGQSGGWEGNTTANLAIAAETGGDIRLYTNGSASLKAIINTSGNVGIGVTSPAAKLHVKGGDFSLEQSGGNGNKMFLTTDHNAHYIQANGYWVDVIGNANEVFRVFGGTNGTSEYLRVTGGGNLTINSGRVGIGNTNPQAALDISSSYSIQGGVYTYYYTGSATGQTNINLDINVNNEGGGGNVFKIEAGFAHYYGMAYNAIGEWWCTSRGTNVINTYILNAGSANGGTWSSSKPTTSVLRITKSAGTYVGGGKYWVKVTYRPY